MIDLSSVSPSFFAPALECNLRRFATPEKAMAHCLVAVRLRLDADATWLYMSPSVRNEKADLLVEGDGALFDETLVRDFAEHRSPKVPRSVLLSPLRVRGRLLGVVGAARAGRDFERGSGRDLNRLSRIIGLDLARREEERVSRVLDRIREKIVSELRPRDLAYQILHGLYRLVHHDHSAALLTYDSGAGVFRVEAEKIIWKKAESVCIGHEIPVAPELLAELRRSAEVRVLSGDGRVDGGDADGLFRGLLDYNRAQGLPRATSILCAPLFHDSELLGLLKLATWKHHAFDANDRRVVRRFLPAASAALRNARVKTSLENQAVQAEMRAGLVTLARAVAHDVNNAVGGILPLAEQIQEDLEAGRLDPVSLDGDLAVIIDSAALCKRIFSNMLRVGTERSGSGPVDVAQVLRKMQPMLEALVEARSVELEIRAAEDLLPVRFSKQHLERIVWNLVTNANEALGAKTGADKRIEISARSEPDGTLVLRIEDNGPGIDADALKKVHEPFYTTKPNGTGLGLTLCRSMAWQYGGTMRIDSKPGQGTQVEIRLAPAAPRASNGDQA